MGRRPDKLVGPVEDPDEGAEALIAGTSNDA